MNADTDGPELGPSQQEVYEILEEDGGELRRGEIAERSDRLSKRAVDRPLQRLTEVGLVEKRQIDVRGWFAYRVKTEEER